MPSPIMIDISGSARVARAGERVLAIANFFRGSLSSRWLQTQRKDSFGVTPKPTRGTRALPGRIRRSSVFPRLLGMHICWATLRRVFVEKLGECFSVRKASWDDVASECLGFHDGDVRFT